MTSTIFLTPQILCNVVPIKCTCHTFPGSPWCPQMPLTHIHHLRPHPSPVDVVYGRTHYIGVQCRFFLIKILSIAPLQTCLTNKILYSRNLTSNESHHYLNSESQNDSTTSNMNEVLHHPLTVYKPLLIHISMQMII